MKNLIIYHANCNDGFCAAWIADNALRDTDRSFYAASYNELPQLELMNKETNVYILDFSYSLANLQDICNNAQLVVLLDHHKTAIESLPNAALDSISNLYYLLDTKHSGARLTWNYFNTGEEWIPDIIRYVEDRDLWKFELPYSEEFNLYLNTVPKTFEAWDSLTAQIDERGPAEIFGHGSIIKRYYALAEADVIKQTCTGIEFNGIRGLVCNCSYLFASSVGNKLAEQSGTFGATWYQDSKNDIIFSIRSIGDFDVSAIAKTFGGGGHKNAAGFKIPAEAWKGQDSTRVWCISSKEETNDSLG